MIIKYFSAFLAILLLGNIADVPVMFLGVRGELSLYFVFIAGFSTDILSDLFWYWFGQKIGVERFEKIWFFRKKKSRMSAIGKALDKYGFPMLFLSKYITSLGIPMQIVAGAHKYPLKKMLFANVLGASSLLLVVYGLASFFASDAVAEKYLKNADLAMLVFLVVIVLLHYLISKPVNRLLIGKNGKESNPSSDGNI